MDNIVRMIPETENDEIIKQTKGHDYLLPNKNLTVTQWENENRVSAENAKNSILSNGKDKSDMRNCVHDSLLNGVNMDMDQTIEDKIKINDNVLQIHKSAKECARQDSCKGLLDARRVLIGPRGEILTRENTVVAGCTTCTGGRLISCAKIKCTSTLCWQQTSKKPSKISKYLQIYLN